MLQIRSDGSGQVIPDDIETRNIYIPPEELHGFHPGDRVTVELYTGRKGRVRGRITKVHERSTELTLVGVIAQGRRHLIIQALHGEDEYRYETPDHLDPKKGEAVVFRVLKKCKGTGLGDAVVDEVLGEPNAFTVHLHAAVLSAGLPMAFEDEVLAEADAAPDVKPEEVLDGLRRDLRSVCQVTIDGADARDFDDAVGARRDDGGWRVWVSIADVASYVTEGSALDRSAVERGTSVYFPHRVLPMLPERLSNGLCSLRPNEPRLTLTCEFRVSRRGEVSRVDIYPSLIESAARLTYEQAQAIIDGEPTPKGLKPSIASMVKDLGAASRAIRKERRARGCLDFDLPEAKVVFDANGVPEGMKARERFAAHKLIEDLMIAANEAVARYMLEHDCSGLFRIHLEPAREKLAPLRQWAKLAGVRVDFKRLNEPLTMSRFITELQKRDSQGVIQMFVLQSLAQARYSPLTEGHFGLASQAYLHFTSPIRRYPDLLVHRALWRHWRGQDPIEDLDFHASQTSSQERRAVSAERDVLKLIGCIIAESHVGETVKATVVGVREIGLFVRSEELFVEGLLPMEEIGRSVRDYMEFIEERMCLRGTRSGTMIKLGDELDVTFAKVSIENRRIDFSLSENAESRPGRERGHGGAGFMERARKRFGGERVEASEEIERRRAGGGGRRGRNSRSGSKRGASKSGQGGKFGRGGKGASKGGKGGKRR
ncbi:MAG: VacB/RNase II family 3'-5' exoribonuclease [Myxococcota bacterium]|nr:VacB/RNase II family 3'-5' exoribonuclease [Myxococcota bacterium]